jgi:TetR/AcrR family transcriptional regulator
VTHLFESLEEEKKQRILNAALNEFADHGFDKASTNRIVKHAEIGKGMLFHYFNTKKDLYYYLLHYCLDRTLNDYLKQIDITERDFIERFKKAGELKMELFAEHPDVLNFLGTFFLEDIKELPEDIQAKYAQLQKEGYEKIYSNIDYSLFRENVDVEKAFKMINWVIEGYEKELKDSLKGQPFSELNMEPYFKEFYKYLEMLKSAFYKKEGEK